MFGLKFSKLPRHRKFSYTPLYYDEDKENLKERVQQLKREMGEAESTEQSVKNNITKAYARVNSQERYSGLPSQRFYGLKILLIAGIIGFIFVKVLSSDLIDLIFGYLSR